jgi:hypothetical protein
MRTPRPSAPGQALLLRASKAGAQATSCLDPCRWSSREEQKPRRSPRPATPFGAKQSRRHCLAGERTCTRHRRGRTADRSWRGLLQVLRADVSDQLAAASFDRAPSLGRQVDRRERPGRVLLAQGREPDSLGGQCQRELPEAGIVSDQQDRADLFGERLESRVRRAGEHSTRSGRILSSSR